MYYVLYNPKSGLRRTSSWSAVTEHSTGSSTIPAASSWYFINGVGYGIDGYCCEVADKMHAQGIEDINYSTAAE